MSESVLVGVSGGVDSICSCLKLRDLGYQVAPVFLKMKDQADERDVQRIARFEEVTGLTVETVDCRELFRQRVIEPFLQELTAGRTPNPCVICNQFLKVRLLFGEADRRQIGAVATGHYAKILQKDGLCRLARGASAKDQSYMLYRLPQAYLERLVFPLENSEKGQVRRLAREALGGSFGDGDSQDICFLGSLGLNAFLASHVTGAAIQPGQMVSDSGQVLGRHRGLAHYTVGQRKGLGLGGGPWYVTEKRLDERQLILSHVERPERRIILKDPVWHVLPDETKSYLVQTRYRSHPKPCTLRRTDEGRWAVLLDAPSGASAPGQSAVVYDGELVVGGGIIHQSCE